MKAKRNDPCPCGSAKKYKACCMPGDLARERIKAFVGEDVFEAVEQQMQAIVNGQTAWEADVVLGRVAGGSDDSPKGFALVAVAGFIVHGEAVHHPLSAVPDRATAVAQAVSAAGRQLGHLPERLRVRDEALASALAPLLAARGVEVEAGPMPELDEAVQELMTQAGAPHMAERFTSPDTWRETGASLEELAAFHRAAAEFYRVAPWNDANFQDVLALGLPDGATWGASVMGDGGVSYGLATYSAPEDLVNLLVAGDPFSAGGAMRGYALTVDFDERRALSRAMLKEITAGGWPIAGPRAHPRLFALNAPDNRVTAEHVRLATLFLRTVATLARDEDPEAETGVRVALLPVPGMEDDGEDEALDYFTPPTQAVLMCADGPGADLEAPLRAWDEPEALEAAEEARLERLTVWLEEEPADEATSAEDAGNARRWTDFLEFTGVPAGGATEYDLRLFLYDDYPRRGEGTPLSARALGGSLRRVFRFLEEREGIRYPFAEAVLAELDEVVRRGEADGMAPHEVLHALYGEIYDDLENRVMLHGREAFAGRQRWPDVMSPEVAILDRELQRRWLLWYDEAVRQGITRFGDLEAALEERRRAWETVPHPGLGDGRTPADVVHAYLQSRTPVEADWRKVMG